MKPERGLILCLLLLLAATSALNACNTGKNSVGAADEAISNEERKFVDEAQQIHAAEIKIGRLAMDRSQNRDVKAMADMIVDDHEEALARCVDLIQKNHIPQAGSLVPETQKDIDHMATLSGVEFDREFVNMMVADHKKAYELFRERSVAPSQSGVQEYAKDLLPTLEKHLTNAQKLQSKLFNGAMP